MPVGVTLEQGQKGRKKEKVRVNDAEKLSKREPKKKREKRLGIIEIFWKKNPKTWNHLEWKAKKYQ